MSEQTIMEISATLEGAGGLGTGKLRVTSDRLVFERRTMFGRAGDVSSFPLSTIQAASLKGMLEKKLTVRAGSTELVFTPSLTGDSGPLKSVNDLLQRAIAGIPLRGPGSPADAPPAPIPAATPDAGWIGELERLAKLHAIGALDAAEFAAAKARLLADRGPTT